MDEIWITSDLHLMHNKPFLWQPRGFFSTEEMCDEIVRRWNWTVKSDDLVYNLGDIALSDIDAAIPYLQKLNGYQIWIRGNHDTDNKVEKILNACPNIHLLGSPATSYSTIIKDGKWSFYLSHYPTLTGNNEPWRKFVNLCGHSHTQDEWSDWDKMCYHVEMDAHNCFPVNLKDIREKIKEKRAKDNI